MKKIALVSLGCAKNAVDSEMILAMFPRDRFVLTTSPEGADLIIVNTCGFIESAKKESIDVIMEMAKMGGKLVVVGCLAERYYKELKDSLPEADLIVPIRDYKELASKLGSLLGEEGILQMNPIRRVLSTAPYSSYLRISDGCDNFCAFCAIPFIRGRFKSRPYEEILEEARILKEQGVKEISLISQDTTVYGKDFEGGRPNIVDLLSALEGIRFYSIRLLYLYPSEIEDELIEKIAKSTQIAHYFDIPVQTASDKMLTLMKRHAGKKETMDLFKRIKEICPDAVTRTTLIAGFPGETKKDHEEALEMMKEVAFDHLGCFPYSREEGTAGAILPHQCRELTKRQRTDEIMKLQRSISYENNKKRVGEVMEGLVIGKGKKQGEYLLRSYWNAPDDIDGQIIFSSPKDLTMGEVVKVKITSAFVYDLYGVLEISEK